VLDLAALATDPDPGDQGKLKFAVKGSTPTDSRLGRRHAAEGVGRGIHEEGTRADLTVTADDGTTTPATTISITVTASTRPLASANDDVIAESAQGSTESVPVLANDVNLFPTPRSRSRARCWRPGRPRWPSRATGWRSPATRRSSAPSSRATA
jgi:hypothetical protein